MSGRRRHRERSYQRGYTSIMGTGQAVTKLREIGEHVVTEAKAALAEGAQLIVDEAKSRVPVKSGKLRDSIKAVSEQEGAAYVLSANAKNKNGIAYGQFVEWSPKINQPFLYPAMDAKRGEVYALVKDAIKEAIDRGS